MGQPLKCLLQNDLAKVSGREGSHYRAEEAARKNRKTQLTIQRIGRSYEYGDTARAEQGLESTVPPGEPEV